MRGSQTERRRDRLLDLAMVMCQTRAMPNERQSRLELDDGSRARFPIRLKQLAGHLRLSPTTVSLVLNPAALKKMGRLAAELVVRRISNSRAEYPRELVVKPDLIVRQSACPASSLKAKLRREPRRQRQA